MIAISIGSPNIIFSLAWVKLKKWTPKSDKIERRRCSGERDSPEATESGIIDETPTAYDLISY